MAELQIASIFGDHMVLQRQKSIRVWGTAAAGGTVTVILSDDRVAATTVVGSDGLWSTQLAAREAGRGLLLTITDGVTTRVVRDVAVGEVWIAGGQSNMEFHVEFDADRDDVLAGDMNPDIRFFDVPEMSYIGQDAEYDYSHFDHWRTCTPEDLRYFSAVGYYFAVDIQQSLGVPVGIVGCNWGGTPAAAWADPARLTGGARVWLDEYNAGLEQIDIEADALVFRSHAMNDRTDPFGDPVLYHLLRNGFTREEEEAVIANMAERVIFTVGTLHPNRPGGLFTTMVQRIAPFSARGVIWYQGESDTPHHDVHASVLTAVIESWRAEWGDPGLVFLITQLAPFGKTLLGGGELFPQIREQQARVARTVPGTWMASSSDAGMETDIHPKRKRPIGVRLALLARGHVYGQDIVCDAPAAASLGHAEGAIRVQFDHADGLVLRARALPIRVEDRDGMPLPIDDLALDGTDLLIRGDFPSVVTVHFAQDGFYDVGLSTAAGIPALPFRLTTP